MIDSYVVDLQMLIAVENSKRPSEKFEKEKPSNLTTVSEAHSRGSGSASPSNASQSSSSTGPLEEKDKLLKAIAHLTKQNHELEKKLQGESSRRTVVENKLDSSKEVTEKAYETSVQLGSLEKQNSQLAQEVEKLRAEKVGMEEKLSKAEERLEKELIARLKAEKEAHAATLLAQQYKAKYEQLREETKMLYKLAMLEASSTETRANLERRYSEIEELDASSIEPPNGSSVEEKKSSGINVRNILFGKKDMTHQHKALIEKVNSLNGRSVSNKSTGEQSAKFINLSSSESVSRASHLLSTSPVALSSSRRNSVSVDEGYESESVRSSRSSLKKSHNSPLKMDTSQYREREEEEEVISPRGRAGSHSFIVAVKEMTLQKLNTLVDKTSNNSYSKVEQELVETEKQYVHDLKLISTVISEKTLKFIFYFPSFWKFF